jgi:hypothetical protein
MAIEIVELSESRKVSLAFDTQSADLVFFGYRNIDDTAVRADFLSYIPAIFQGLLFKNLDLSHIGGGCWLGNVRYEPMTAPAVDGQGNASDPPETPEVPGPTDPLGAEYSVTISAVTEHITQSKSTRSRTKRGGGAAADSQKAIGVTADGEVQGCDRIAPHLEWSTTRTLSYITLGYLDTLYQMVGKVNNATFYGFPAGTVLFMGSDISGKDTEKKTVSFKFACQPNETDIEICDGLTVPAKNGWEYLWVSYKNVEDAGTLFMQPSAAYVERIYDTASYTVLGIGS